MVAAKFNSLGGTMIDNDHQISKYDRLRGSLHDTGLFTRQSTIRNLDKVTGRAETFVVETARDDERGGDFIFVELIDEANLVTRMALPPKVANAIESQRESLTTKRRSLAGKRLAKERMDRGELPGFMKKKKKKAE
jgi:hypothetical protein